MAAALAMDQLPRQASFAEEIASSEDGNHGLLSAGRYHRKLDLALLDIEEGVGRVGLRKNDVTSGVALYGPSGPGLGQKVPGAEWRIAVCFHLREGARCFGSWFR